MDLQSNLDVGCEPGELFSYVRVLDEYPRWLSIVTAVEPLEADPAGDAWSVELRAKIGPLARSKRLRMVRTQLVVPGGDGGGGVDGRWSVRFERVETDGRSHSPWVLAAEVVDAPAGDGGVGARLSMDLHYGGSLLGPVIQRMLADEIDKAKVRLARLVDAP